MKRAIRFILIVAISAASTSIAFYVHRTVVFCHALNLEAVIALPAKVVCVPGAEPFGGRE